MENEQLFKSEGKTGNLKQTNNNPRISGSHCKHHNVKKMRGDRQYAVLLPHAKLPWWFVKRNMVQYKKVGDGEVLAHVALVCPRA